jgi:hypothetical protein
MKTIFMLALSIFFSISTQAEVITTNPSKVTAISEIGGAKWVIGEKMPITILSSSDILTDRWFFISNGNYLSDTHQVTLEFDGQSLIFPIHSGGGALIYGKSITLKQSAAPGESHGNWSTVPADKLTSLGFPWVINPKTGSNAIVGRFDVTREFLITFGVPDGPLSCTEGKMTVLVDGKPIDSKKKTVFEFNQGSAVIGKGQIVSVNVTGNCPENGNFYGTLQLLPQ